MNGRISTRALAVIAFAVIAGCSPSAKQDTAPQPHAPASGNADARAGVSSRVSVKQAKPPTLDELLLFYPSKYPDGDWKPKGLKYEDIWFCAEDGTRLHGWYCPCDKPRAVLLFAHGNAGNLSQRSPRLRYFQKDLRVTALIFDYRGYGRSEGVPTVEGILQDGRSARTFLARRAGITEAQIVLMGRSLGGAVAVQLAAESPSRGLILESTFSSFQDVAAHHYPRLAWLVPATKLNSVAQIKRHRGSLLQSHGDADGTVPYSLGLKLFHAANDPKWFVTIPHGDHNDPQSPDYFKQLERFIGTFQKN
jgi:uncharacterized protein